MITAIDDEHHTSTGGAVGFTSKPTMRTRSPTAPHKPNPIPLVSRSHPDREQHDGELNGHHDHGTHLHVRATNGPGHAQRMTSGLTRFSNEKISSHFSWVRSLRSWTTI